MIFENSQLLSAPFVGFSQLAKLNADPHFFHFGNILSARMYIQPEKIHLDTRLYFPALKYGHSNMTDF